MTDRETVTAWMRAGTTFFTRQVSELDERGLRAPSGLDGWSRAHVVAHVARNAEALARLAAWARTGVETPMYSGAAQRNDDIEASAVQDLGGLTGDLAAACAALDEALASLTGPQWEARVRTAQGAMVPATVIPWMRVREVWLHAVDLGTGLDLSALPGDLVDALIGDVAGTFDGRDGVPAVTLVAADRAESWAIGDGGGGGTTVRADAADLLGWLTGRPGPGTIDGAPGLPTWL